MPVWYKATGHERVDQYTRLPLYGCLGPCLRGSPILWFLHGQKTPRKRLRKRGILLWVITGTSGSYYWIPGEVGIPSNSRQEMFLGGQLLSQVKLGKANNLHHTQSFQRRRIVPEATVFTLMPWCQVPKVIIIMMESNPTAYHWRAKTTSPHQAWHRMT